ncbi:MAG: hypothetical protein Q8936_24575 [Bacillota bacterium]|nr:hypothetical protein [Bacillota bacterium]
MKRNQKKHTKLILSAALFIIFAILIINRYSFGVWNPASLPDRVQCYNRRYYISTLSPKTFNEKEKPAYAISSPDNMTGKALYTQDPKGEFVPTVIYLKMSDGKYQTYVLSGGP